MKLTSRKKKIIIVLCAILLIGVGISLYFFNPYYWYLENHHSKIYDLNYSQKPITTKARVDSVMSNFKQVAYADLDEKYIQYSQSDKEKYKKILSGKIYYIVKGEDIFKFLVGDFRVKDFLVKDKYYSENLNHLREERIQYFLIDKNLLYALLELQNDLEEMGYDKNAFTINYAHRHPLLNQEVGGTSVSYHIRGQAIDLIIWDINRDGLPGKEDKQIVLDLLDTKIIKDKGGIGRYPWSNVVHFDVRGYKARWDKQ
jgi:uncharacterized protein YcbK (DUF882 family)